MISNILVVQLLLVINRKLDRLLAGQQEQEIRMGTVQEFLDREDVELSTLEDDDVALLKALAAIEADGGTLTDAQQAQADEAIARIDALAKADTDATPAQSTPVTGTDGTSTDAPVSTDPATPVATDPTQGTDAPVGDEPLPDAPVTDAPAE